MLKAYTLYRPEEGYCQAQAPIAAVLLMHMPAEVRARCREGRETQGPESWDQREDAGLFGVVLAGRVLGSWHLFAPKLGWCREVPVAPGALCLLPPAPVVPGSRVGAAGTFPGDTGVLTRCPLACSKRSGAWCRSARSTSPATTVRSW